MLHQLKNGDWIRLGDVRTIRVWDLEVVIITTNMPGQGSFCKFDSKEEAEKYRDELATLVNNVWAPLVVDPATVVDNGGDVQ